MKRLNWPLIVILLFLTAFWIFVLKSNWRMMFITFGAMILYVILEIWKEEREVYSHCVLPEHKFVKTGESREANPGEIVLLYTGRAAITSFRTAHKYYILRPANLKTWLWYRRERREFYANRRP